MTAANPKNSFSAFAGLFKEAFKEVEKNDPLRMAGATAFFTTFALPPILIIIIQVLGLIFDPRKISRQLFSKLAEVIGQESMHQVLITLIAFRHLAQNWYITIGGFLFLVFVATTLFKVIKSSLNQVWKIKVIEKQSLWLVVQSRLTAIMVILVAGILFVAGLLAEGMQAYLGKFLSEVSPLLQIYFSNALNYLFAIIIVTLWFTIVFRYLPDGRPQWKVALTGAFTTSILFNIGKLVLHVLLSYSNINTVYGASGSVVLLLLFVFYSSLILYYGAAFTKVWGNHHHMPIKPLPYAMHYQLTEANDDETGS